MLLDVRQLLEGLVAVVARILAHVAVHQRVLGQLLRGRERLEAQRALVVLLFGTVSLLGVTLHVRLVLELLHSPAEQSVTFSAAALASSPPTSSVQAGRASVQSAAWANSTVLDKRLSTRCRCRSPSTTVI